MFLNSRTYPYTSVYSTARIHHCIPSYLPVHISRSSIPLSVPASDHPLVATAAKCLKRWSEKGTDSGIEEPDMLLAQQVGRGAVILPKSTELVVSIRLLSGIWRRNDKVQRTTSRLRRLHDLRLHDFHDFTTCDRSINRIYSAKMSF
jgi:hypothetical protein